LIIHLIKYLFLFLRFYFHIFAFLYDIFYSNLLDLMQFEGLEQTEDVKKHEKETMSHAGENENDKVEKEEKQYEKREKKSWYLGRREDILNNRQYNDHPTLTTSVDETDQEPEEEQNRSLLSSIGGYFHFGLITSLSLSLSYPPPPLSLNPC
jgi:hypothetical protein